MADAVGEGRGRERVDELDGDAPWDQPHHGGVSRTDPHPRADERQRFCAQVDRGPGEGDVLDHAPQHDVLAEPNLDLITDIIACPGLDYCSLANARSIPLAQKIANRFADRERQRDLGELKLKISGCINACGHHHAGHIGILGVDKKGTENYQLSLGGSGAEDVSLAKITGPGFSEDGVVDAIERVTDRYVALRDEGERFLDTYRRVGFEPFKEAIYG